MPDRKKVIKGLEYCITHYNCRDNRKPDCPYLDLCEPIKDATGNTLMRDALVLLKEQEQAMKEKDGTISNLIVQIKEISQCYERVVRCKDCIYGTHEKNESTGMTWIYCGHHRENRPEDWFCASGSRI